MKFSALISLAKSTINVFDFFSGLSILKGTGLSRWCES
jgi:hypothetical protein